MPDFFDISFNNLVEERIPPRMRTPRLLAFANALSAEVNSQYQLFRLNRKANLYSLGITPQKCYLERLLNDRYDFTQRRIYIDDSVDKPPFYIYQNAELKPQFIYRRSENKPKYIYTGGESGDYKDDFTVFVPLDISFELNEMISLVKVYKLAGTKFKIQRF